MSDDWVSQELKSFFRRNWSAGSRLNPYKRYINKKWGVFAIGNLSNTGYSELHALLKDRLGGAVRFDKEYVSSLGLDSAGEDIFHSALIRLCRLIELLVGTSFHKGLPLHPWRWAVAIAPTLKVNASARITAEKNSNTALIVLNAGVLLENLNRLHAYFSVSGFLDSLRDKVQPVLPVGNAQSGFLKNISDNAKFRAIASEIAVKATIMIVFHEVAHFLRGHLAYLRVNKHADGAAAEIARVGCWGSSQLPYSERRLLELDADQVAGRLSAIFWRELDHPAVAPADCRNEAFSMEIIFSVLSNHLIFESLRQSDDYYSPVWRTQHLLQNFWREFFRVDRNDHDAEEQWEAIDNQMFILQIKIAGEIERACNALGFQGANSFDNFVRETETLLASDEAALNVLRGRLVEYMPPKFSFS